MSLTRLSGGNGQVSCLFHWVPEARAALIGANEDGQEQIARAGISLLHQAGKLQGLFDESADIDLERTLSSGIVRAPLGPTNRSLERGFGPIGRLRASGRRGTGPVGRSLVRRMLRKSPK